MILRARTMKTVACTAVLLITHASEDASGSAIGYRLSGEASAWILGALSEDEEAWNAGTRYIPSLSISRDVGGGNLLDLYLYLDAFAAASSVEDNDDYDIDFYRFVLRYTTQRTETRLGLQKIVFGPGIILRSLMWFDSIDPRDPRQLTNGVWALRFRYDALDNSSIWLWGIYPDGKRKGLEIAPSEEGYPELGGRYLRSVLSGEMAMSFNSRYAEVPGTGLDFRENWLALDAKWDIEAGLWFEAEIQHQSEDFIPMQWRKMITLGADYTFGVGNGLYLALEHMGIYMSSEAFESDEDYQTTAWMLNFPIGLIDNVSAIGYYSWDAEKYFQYLSWQRTWDNWILHLSVFRYPETDESLSPFETVQPVAGTGGQKLVKGLAPGGSLVVIDYIPKSPEERPWGPTPSQHMSEQELTADLEEAGFRKVTQYDFLPEQYFMVYEVR